MGRFWNAIRALQGEDPDFDRVRNCPADGFAVNCSCFFRDALVSGGHQAIGGIDDYGNHVADIPLSWTSRRIFLDLFNVGIDLPFDDASVPLDQLVRHLASVIQEICETSLACQLDLDVPAECFGHLKMERMVWLPGAGGDEWTLLLDTDELDRLALRPRHCGEHEDE